MRFRGKNSEQAVTLIEVMVALFIATVIGFGVAQLIKDSSVSETSMQSKSAVDQDFLTLQKRFKASMRFVLPAPLAPTPATCNGLSCVINDSDKNGTTRTVTFSTVCQPAPSSLATVNFAAVLPPCLSAASCPTGKRPEIHVSDSSTGMLITIPANARAAGATNGTIAAAACYSVSGGNVVMNVRAYYLDRAKLQSMQRTMAMPLSNTSGVEVMR